MKKALIATLAALLLFVTPSFADLAWHVVVNDLSLPGYYSITGTSDTVLHACGTEGVVSKSTDRGVNWTSTTVGSNQYTWYAVTFPSANTGYIAGTRRDLTRAVLYKTTNGADPTPTWNLNYEVGTTTSFTCSCFATESIGWVAGNDTLSPPSKVHRTTNGGTSWDTANPPWTAQIFGLHAVHDGSNYNVWVVGANKRIARSMNGGVSFTDLTPAGFPSVAYVGVFFINKDTGWIVGRSGTIIKTNNGTDDTPSWTAQTSGTTQDLARVYFADANNGWVVGANGTILTTTDGGSNWIPVTWGTAAPTAIMYSLYYYDGNNIWAVGQGSRVVAKYGGTFFTSMDPASALRGTTVSVKVTGSGFLSGAQVGFSGSGITVSSVNVDSSTQISFTAAVGAQAATGSRNLIIYNGDGTTTTFSGAFAVIPETGNIPIDTVVPGYGYQNTTKKIMVGGSGFNSTARVIVSGSGVTATVDTAKLTSTSIPVTLVIGANAAVGARDVMVTQGADIGIKTSAFEVKSASSTGQTIKNVVFGPNPLTRNAGNIISVQFEDTSTGQIDIPVFDMTGTPRARLQYNTAAPGLQKLNFNVVNDAVFPLGGGTYKVLFYRGGLQNTGKLVIAR